jgi:L-threonylcarbamoyladenylate synthase
VISVREVSSKHGFDTKIKSSTGLRITAPTPAAIRNAAGFIRAGNLVAFPTETVYGLGADATNPIAVARIFEAKGRPEFNPLIVHVADIDHARTIADHWPELAQRLTQAFWPGPLTIVLPRRANAIADLVTAGLPTVALRMPDHPVALELLRASGVAIAAPSANLSGSVSPTTAQHVSQSLNEKVASILDGGPCRAGIESTVLSLVPDKAVLLRPGAIPIDAIESVIGNVSSVDSSHSVAPMAPGMLRRHYTTSTPFYIAGTEPADLDPDRTGYLVLQHDSVPGYKTMIEVLSHEGDLVEAAANLFAAMRRLDEADLDAIVACSMPNIGLGIAINDRLTRAAAR